MATVKRRWQILAIALALLWAGYVAFDMVPPILVSQNGLYLINARFLQEAVPRCLAAEDRLGCFEIFLTRLNTMEVYCRALVVMISGAAAHWLHLRLERRYATMGVIHD